MSAWIVSKKHVDLIVAAVRFGTRDGILEPNEGVDCNALGQLLVTECVASVSYRYPDDKPGELPGPGDGYYLEPYRWVDPAYRPSAAELYKAIDCYAYQSSEHPGWRTSDALLFCESIRNSIAVHSEPCRRMREDRTGCARRWPEYDAAPWGFDEGEIAVLWAKTHPDGRALLAGVKSHPGDTTPVSVLSDWLQEHGLIGEPLDIYPHALAGLLSDLPDPPAPPREEIDRDTAISRIKSALRRRSGRPWSVTGGRGTAWGWVKIDAPPKRRTWQYVQVRNDPTPPAPGAVYCGAMNETPPGYCDIGREDRIAGPDSDPWARQAADAGRSVLYLWEVHDPAREYGHMSPTERAELATLLGLSRPVHHQGESIPASRDHYAEYVDRAEGRQPAVCGKRYWD